MAKRNKKSQIMKKKNKVQTENWTTMKEKRKKNEGQEGRKNAKRRKKRKTTERGDIKRIT